MLESIGLYLSYIVDLAHLILLLIPVSIYFVKMPRIFIIFMLLLSSLVPVTWYFLGHECLLTLLSRKLSGRKNDNITFSENYLYQFYYILMKIAGYKKTYKNFNKVIFLHWTINIYIIWFYLFFYK
tara:strand:- start:567 stop:944 length:378 start_codon:yes stop_codon:yes gene_type:complete